jgi:hypothetical protein
MRSEATRWHRGPRERRVPVVGRSIVGRLALVVGIVGALVAAPGSGRGDGLASAAAPPPYTIEVTPTTGLVDGQAVDVVVHPAAGARVLSSIVYICREDATYTTPDDLVPMLAGKCPDRPVSSSASGPWPIRAYPDGSAEVSRIHIGTGTVTWGPTADPNRFGLTCDPTHPCRLVLQVQIGGTRYIESSTILRFSDSTALGTCGGTDPSAPNTVGSDRMLAPWVGLTQAYCAATGTHQPTQAVFGGEGDGQRAFNDGSADLVYSSYGARFPGHDDEPKRDAVIVPTAINAAVVGVLGGYPTTDPQWPERVPKSYDDVKVTMPELATLFGQGKFAFAASYTTALQDRNLQLRGITVVNDSNSLPFAPAGGEAASWFATSSFDALAPNQWKTASLTVDGNPPDVARGPSDSLAVAVPPFAPALFSLYSGRSQLQKLVAENEFKPDNYGPIWVLTDLATATLLGIPTVAIENSNGEFVKPTTASLQAATATMTEQSATHAATEHANANLLPTIGHDPPGAYPLTFVENAVAPHEPLMDENCTARTDTQKLLASWLAYLTGEGQAHLTNGLVPLPPSLLATAQAQQAGVGTAPVTGKCGATAPPDAAPNDLPPGVDVGSGGGPINDLPGGFPSSSGGSGGASAGGGTGSSAGGPTGGAAPGGGNAPTAIEPIAAGARPGIGGGVSSVFGAAVALVGLALVGGLGGFLSSRRMSGGEPGGHPT